MKSLNQLYTNNRNLYHPDVMVNMTVKCMLNPKNKDFYIKSLTLADIAAIIEEDSSRADTIWTAFHIAREELIKEEELILAEFNYHLDFLKECLEEGFITQEKYERDVRALKYKYNMGEII